MPDLGTAATTSCVITIDDGLYAVSEQAIFKVVLADTTDFDCRSVEIEMTDSMQLDDDDAARVVDDVPDLLCVGR